MDKVTRSRFSRRRDGTSIGIVWAVSLFGLTIAQSALGQGLIHRGDNVWVNLQGNTIRVQDYEVRETFDPKTTARKDFIKRNTDLQPILFYTHERGIEMTLGHQRRLVLINDYFASKACQVIVVDLESGNRRRIDEAVVKTYYRHFVRDKRVYMAAQAYGFSPDDKKILIGMVLDYTFAHSREEADLLSKLTPKAWYIVESSNGRVLREFRENDPPERWWEY
jgi:hypothetical protein